MESWKSHALYCTLWKEDSSIDRPAEIVALGSVWLIAVHLA
jgi:hypothetical protein